MAFGFAHGAVQWLAADAATTVYTVSGLSFQPKAIRFYWQGLGSSTDTESTATALRRGVGFATSTSDRRCVGCGENDAATSMACYASYRTDAIAVTNSHSTGGVDGRLDLASITSDGFTLEVDDQVPVNITVFWEAWGGSDITVAVTGEISEPGATGNVDYTVTGFTSGNNGDQVVMFAGVNSAGAAPFGVEQDDGLCIGYATAGTSGENILLTANQDEASANAETDSYALDGECLAAITQGGGNPSARAQLTQFGTDNFRLNWIARTATARKTIFLAIKGGMWRAGSLTIDATTLNATATVSSLPFTPAGVMLISAENAEDSAGTSAAGDAMQLGTGSSTSSRRMMSCSSTDAAADSDVKLRIEYDQILGGSVVGTSAYDLNAMNSDGFQLIVDDNNAGESSSTWIGYLTFGTSSAVTISTGLGSVPITGRANTIDWTTATGLGSTRIAGLAVTLDVVLPVGLGSVPVTGLSPTIDSTVAMGVGSTPITGRAPTIDWTTTTGVGSASITGLAPLADVAVPIPTGLGSVLLTGLAPTIDSTVTTGLGSASITGQSPTIDWSVAAPSGSVPITGRASTIDWTTTTAAGAALITGHAPTVTAAAGTTIDVPVGASTVTGYATDVFPRMPDAGSVLCAGQAPTVFSTLPVHPGVGALAVTGLSPTLDYAVGAGTGSVQVSGLASSLTFGLTTPAGAVTVSGQTPTAALSVGMSAGVLTVSGLANTLATTTATGVGSLPVTGHAVTPAYDIVSAAGSLLITGRTAAVQFEVFISPAAGTLRIAGHIAEVVGEGAIAVPAGTVSVTGQSPAILASVAVPSGSITAIGYSGAVGYGVVPGAGSVASTGYPPALSIGLVTLPGVSALQVTGYSTTWGYGVGGPVGTVAVSSTAPTFAWATATPVAAVVCAGFAPFADAAKPARDTLFFALDLDRTHTFSLDHNPTLAFGLDLDTTHVFRLERE